MGIVIRGWDCEKKKIIEAGRQEWDLLEKTVSNIFTEYPTGQIVKYKLNNKKKKKYATLHFLNCYSIYNMYYL